MSVVTRFAPSPTGYLHIGGARTALFNWLYARGRGGEFHLRIEDTDRARSTPEATEAIFAGLRWLGLDWDGEARSQFERARRHAEVAQQLLEAGHAYRCWSTAEEIAAFRDEAKAKGHSTLFRSPWRDADSSARPKGPSVVRLRAPREGQTVIEDEVQGTVTWDNAQLDDMVLLRSDGSPTYMLAVVVDDHDMGVTHVIRGDDHLGNAPRQAQIWRSMGWEEPVWAHIPLIHGEDGKKLSKRHGALGIEAWRMDGYPPSALRNYLARLGWSHGDDEVFTTEQAVGWFDLSGIGRSPARLDSKKLEHISGRHIAMTPDGQLADEVENWARSTGRADLTDFARQSLRAAIPHVKERARTYPELLEKAHFALAERPIVPDAAAAKSLDPASRALLAELTPHLQTASWTRDMLEDVVTRMADAHDIKLGKLAQPLRAALAGRTATPSVFDMMLVIGRDETIARLNDAA
jgi:glutamyl-tRNA synthetase